MISFREEPNAQFVRLPISSASQGWSFPNSTLFGLARAALVVVILLAAAPALKAEHAKIDLRVTGQGKEATATADRDPPPGGLNDPPVLNVEVNKPLMFQFILTNKYPHGVLEKVTVRYYVVRVKKLGRKPPPSFRESRGPAEKAGPLLEEGVVTKGEFTTNFKPDDRVGTRLTFRISQPGIYSARVETINTESDHEHFSAIDLVAK